MERSYEWAKAILFRMDPEKAHHVTLHVLSALSRCTPCMRWWEKRTEQSWQRDRDGLATHIGGLTLAHPVGLAAGLDKNGVCIPAWQAMGFAFVEVGTVTPLPQAGNDRPRLFRLVEHQALINRMGFNNDGVHALAQRLQRVVRNRRKPLFVNIGKNKQTPNDRAIDDYVAGLRAVYAHGDAFVINVSSPNTPGLRALQEAESMYSLLQAVVRARAELHGQGSEQRKPLFVKIAPDLTDNELADTIRAMQRAGIDGIVATNTTIGRDGVSHHPLAGQAGGLSGRPLYEKSKAMIRAVFEETKGTCPIIGCGGMRTAEEVYAVLQAGASAVQLYTALVYEGPALVSRIVRELAQRMRADGHTRMQDVIGVATTIGRRDDRSG